MCIRDRDGSEAEAHSAPQPGPVQDHNSGPQQPVQEMKPVKKNRIGLKVTALALCLSLIHILYPCGEGAGDAGGILSAAADGMHCAEQLCQSIQKESDCL